MGSRAANKLGCVVWVTGLSGSGKTSLAQDLVSRLKARQVPLLSLDGDKLREILQTDTFSDANHSTQSRRKLAQTYAFLCREIAAQGLTVVIATISLFRDVQRWNRENIPNYFEVYLKVPTDELRRRDPKGIYRRFDAGEIANVAGMDLAVDEPYAPDVLIDFEADLSVQDCSKHVIEALLHRFDWLESKR